jgi:hypothetical protein
MIHPTRSRRGRAEKEYSFSFFKNAEDLKISVH